MRAGADVAALCGLAPAAQDVLKCDHAELRAQAEEKYHPNFAQAFAEAGTPYQTSEAAGMTGGDAASAAAAAQQGRGQARLHHIIRQLCGARAARPLGPVGVFLGGTAAMRCTWWGSL
jgi:hypothetical protein